MASKTMKALVHQAGGTAVVKDIPIPTLTDREVLVRTVAVALNPGDWKGTPLIFSFSPRILINVMY